MEHANTEYETLENSCQVDLAVCKNQLKKSICSLVDLEIKVNKADIATHFSVAVGSLAIASTIAAPNIESYVAEDLIYQTFEKNHESLLAYAEISTPKPSLTSSTRPLTSLTSHTNMARSPLTAYALLAILKKPSRT